MNVIARIKEIEKGMVIVMITMLFIISNAVAQSTQTKKSAHFGLIYPLSTHGSRAAEYTNVFSLHGLAGVSKSETGTSFAGITNVIKTNTKGAQFAGISNHIGDKAEGAQIAGVVNTYESGHGAQIAGFGNIASDSIEGAQIAGFVNTAGDVKGAQIDGFINIANNVQGNQTAGFINIAKNVRGAMVAGFINIADSCEYPIGLINLIKNGEQSISLTTDENLTTLVSFRSGSRRIYGIIGLGANLLNNDAAFAIETGLGVNLLTKPSFRLAAESVTIHLTGFNRGDFQKQSTRLMTSIKVTNRIELFGGPSFNYIETNTKEGKELVSDNHIWRNNHDRQHAFSFGVAGGIKYLLK